MKFKVLLKKIVSWILVLIFMLSLPAMTQAQGNGRYVAWEGYHDWHSITFNEPPVSTDTHEDWTQFNETTPFPQTIISSVTIHIPGIEGLMVTMTDVHSYYFLHDNTWGNPSSFMLQRSGTLTFNKDVRFTCVFSFHQYGVRANEPIRLSGYTNGYYHLGYNDRHYSYFTVGPLIRLMYVNQVRLTNHGGAGFYVDEYHGGSVNNWNHGWGGINASGILLPLSQLTGIAPSPSPTPPPTDGWTEIHGNHYFYIGGARQIGWMDIGENRIFFNPETNGAMATGVVATLNYGVHEFGLDGIWIRKIQDFEWRTIDGDSFFYIDGTRHTGWLQSSGGRIFFIPEADSALATGIISTTTHGVHEFTQDGFWIRQIHNSHWTDGFEFFYVDGVRHTGWLQVADRRIFFIPEAESTLATGVISTSTHGVHEFTPDGFWIRQIHIFGWSGAFFYIDGARHMGWLRAGGNRLYLHPLLNGAIATGIVVITNGETHEFSVNGFWVRLHILVPTPVPTPQPTPAPGVNGPYNMVGYCVFSGAQGGTPSGYGSNNRFLQPIDAPRTGSIPVSTRAELDAIRNNLTGHFHLTNDIDLSGAEWIPIGENSNNAFRGTFDGQGFVIRNLTITGQGFAFNGLFGYTRGTGVTIRNIGMEDTLININRDQNIGTQIRAGAVSGISENLIANSYNTGLITITTTAASGVTSVHAGGITGIARGVRAAYNISPVSVTVDTGTRSGNVLVGGILGSRLTGSGSIENNFNNGDIFASISLSPSSASPLPVRSANAGGITGAGAVTNSYNVGDITAISVSRAWAGGITGNRSNVTDSYNTGTVTGRSTSTITGIGILAAVGGIQGGIGMGYGASSSRSSTNYNVGSLYVSSPVANNITIGGILAHHVAPTGMNIHFGNTATYSYALDMHGCSQGTQLTEAQMRNGASFIGFNFDDVWDISPSVNNGFPFLRFVFR